MEAGCVLVDIGGDITNATAFYDSAIRHTAVVPLGAKNVTNDIAIGLRTSVEQAERLKLGYGSALAALVDPSEMIDVPGVAGRPGKEISQHVLASIIEPRVEEVFSLVSRELKRMHRLDMFTAGMILTGGGALLPGAVELAEQMFDLPVRPGDIANLAHVPDELNNTRYATGHGLLAYGFGHEPTAGGGGRIGGLLKKVEQWITKKL
jgi:cell division protein FtsA